MYTSPCVFPLYLSLCNKSYSVTRQSCRLRHQVQPHIHTCKYLSDGNIRREIPENGIQDHTFILPFPGREGYPHAKYAGFKMLSRTQVCVQALIILINSRSMHDLLLLQTSRLSVSSRIVYPKLYPSDPYSMKVIQKYAYFDKLSWKYMQGLNELHVFQKQPYMISVCML